MNGDSAICEVISAGYAYHARPYAMSIKEGLTHYLFRLQTEGMAKALIDGRHHDIYPGDLLLYSPGEPYELIIEEERQAGGKRETASGDYYLFCRGSWVDEWWAANKVSNKCSVSANEELVTVIRQIILEQHRGKEQNRLISGYLLRALLLLTERNLISSASSSAGTPSFLAFRMRQYITENATGKFSLEDVAEHVGLSVSRAVHLYKSSFGLSMIQHAMNIRLTVAREKILFSQSTLEQIAEDSGFGSYTYFHRVFRTRYGISPGDYRKTSRQFMPPN